MAGQHADTRPKAQTWEQNPAMGDALASLSGRFAGKIHNICLKMDVDHETASEVSTTLVREEVLADDSAAISEVLDRFDIPVDVRVAAMVVIEERSMSRGEMAAISDALDAGDIVRLETTGGVTRHRVVDAPGATNQSVIYPLMLETASPPRAAVGGLRSPPLSPVDYPHVVHGSDIAPLQRIDRVQRYVAGLEADD